MTAATKAPKAKAAMPFAAFRDAILESYRGSAPSTMDRIRSSLSVLSKARVRASDELGRESIVARVLKVLEGRSPSYRNHTLVMIRAILGRAEEMGIIRSVPEFPRTLQSRDVPRRPLQGRGAPRGLRRWSPGDDKLFVDYCTAHIAEWDVHRIYALYRVVRDTGIPPSLALGLNKYHDIDLGGGLITPMVPGGVYRRRAGPPVPIPEELKGELAAWLPRSGCRWAFPGKMRRAPWGGHGNSSALAELKRVAGLAGVEADPNFVGVLRYHVEHIRPTRQDKAGSQPPPRPALELGPPGKPLRVRGVNKVVPTPMERKALKLLAGAYPGGLDGKAMSKGYGSEGWHTILDRLRNRDADLRSAILFPRDRPGDAAAGLYRIAPW